MKKNLLFATTNKKKKKRLNNFLGKTKFGFITLDNLGYTIEEPEETKNSSVVIAVEKAKYRTTRSAMLIGG